MYCTVLMYNNNVQYYCTTERVRRGMLMTRSRRIQRELVAARKIWPHGVHGIQAEQLEVLLKAYRFSVKRGDLQLLSGRWYVTHVGLIGLAARRRCVGVHTDAVAN